MSRGWELLGTANGGVPGRGFSACRKWGLRDVGLSKSEHIRGKGGDFQGAIRTLPKRAPKAEIGQKKKQFWPVFQILKGGQTPRRPPFVTTPVVAANFGESALSFRRSIGQ